MQFQYPSCVEFWIAASQNNLEKMKFLKSIDPNLDIDWREPGNYYYNALDWAINFNNKEMVCWLLLLNARLGTFFS